MSKNGCKDVEWERKMIEYNEDYHLLCPFCHFDYLHPGQRLELEDNPKDTTSVQQFRCEGCPCRPLLVMRFHKGNTFLYWAEGLEYTDLANQIEGSV